uniref:G-patch domain-containing protein n=1 Tax=Polytomella parva TaxID=51329 RepID=A0A7S0YKU9_9CHLO|mmetsp:Transcript_31447/g.57115  ORF Transcript_31447/g.57115 Transcript_31447/m.57115 type:complete len:155 (+) Transcript_31447:899-1363(+)
MAAMGYRAGSGLGRDGSGCTEPIQAVQRTKRTGIGSGVVEGGGGGQGIGKGSECEGSESEKKGTKRFDESPSPPGNGHTDEGNLTKGKRKRGGERERMRKHRREAQEAAAKVLLENSSKFYVSCINISVIFLYAHVRSILMLMMTMMMMIMILY